MRKSGYYWVLNGSTWRIGLWSKAFESWSLCDTNLKFKDRDFAAIDEEMIERADKV